MVFCLDNNYAFNVYEWKNDENVSRQSCMGSFSGTDRFIEYQSMKLSLSLGQRPYTNRPIACEALRTYGILFIIYRDIHDLSYMIVYICDIMVVWQISK